MTASDIIDAFVSGYDGMFGKFEKGECGETSAIATSPDGDSTSSVLIEIPDNLTEEFENRKAFIMSKKKRLIPMGKLTEFQYGGDVDEFYGAILNFHLLGKHGGFEFAVARKGDVLFFVQAYSTTGKGQIPDAERDRIIDAVVKSI